MDWQHAYSQRETPWDLRQVTPPLAALLASDRLGQLGIARGGRVVVPGCGRGHDLRAWATAGFRATGIDIVPAVVAEARELLRWNRVEGAEVLCRDLFGLDDEFTAAYDVAYDYTCFCALPPHLRGAYGAAIGQLVRPGGVWIGLAYPLDPSLTGDGGPPYLVRPEDLGTALGTRFERVADFAPERSVPRRRGAEHWFAWRRLVDPTST